LKSYFDTIPHEPLRARVKEQIADGRVLELLDAFLAQDVLGEMNEATAVDSSTGTPQGAVISPPKPRPVVGETK
jgi:RNA-directed DNA polymerase